VPRQHRGARRTAARFGIGSVPRDEPRPRYTRTASTFNRIMGADVHYVEEGSGDLIVMIHGFASSLHRWDGLEQELARDPFA
jgi:hypothetical protein